MANRGPTHPDHHATLTSEVIDLTERTDDAEQAPPFAFESYDDLMRRAISDSDAFAALYEKTVDEILQFFRRRVYDVELSADLTAETYAQLLRNVRKFDASRGSARQYLYGVAKNQYLLWQRKGVVSNRHRHALGIVDSTRWEHTEERTVDRLDAARSRRRLGQAMALLTTPERDAITLRVIHTRPYREIALTLGCSEVAVRVRVSRGLSKLATILDREAEA